MEAAVSEDFKHRYLRDAEASRAARMAWWQQARFGMFIHWGLYSQLGRNEWVMNMERIPIPEYEPLADTWKPKPRAAREWAALAKKAGMRYMVLTTKHHEGFLLWDSKMSAYNAVKRGPRRDLVREYVDAAREFGLKVGFYYSLMDWHHPDGATCARDEAARIRFIEYTQGCVRELMTNYGKIDILWYDVSWPLSSPDAWDSYRMNAMVRKLQPHILINDRSQLPEDFGTPEEHVTAAAPGRGWEACMTFNGSWGWQQTPPEDWHSARKVIEMLNTCSAGQGNLLLNIGPHPDGSVPREAAERLTAVGRWLKTYGEPAAYGRVDRASRIVSALGKWSRKGLTHYFWCHRWPGRELAIGALDGKLQSARLLPSGRRLPFEQVRGRLVIRGLPERCPDGLTGVGVIELKFRAPPNQLFSAGCVMPDPAPAQTAGGRASPPVTSWMVSRLMPKRGTVASALPRRLGDMIGWQALRVAPGNGFVDIHERVGLVDGIIYLGARFRVRRAGRWPILVGHDGGVRVFVDGRPVLTEPALKNPAVPGRSTTVVSLGKGLHEVVVALDTAAGKGWGIFFQWGAPIASRGGVRKPAHPECIA